MSKPNFSAQLPDRTLSQIESLKPLYNGNKTQIVINAIDRMYQQETKSMKIIKVGKVNDLIQYAVKDPDANRYYPLSESDLQHESPDAKIYYDSGVYPGVGLEQLPQYICDKASNR